MMKTTFHLLALALIAATSSQVHAQDASCEQIRAEIFAQTTILPTANIELLKKISGRTECKFTSSEVYRAAFGDKPMPGREAQAKHSHDD